MDCEFFFLSSLEKSLPLKGSILKDKLISIIMDLSFFYGYNTSRLDLFLSVFLFEQLFSSSQYLVVEM